MKTKAKKLFNKVFGGLNISWKTTIILAVVLGVWTALMAIFVPDGNSFHDIAVTLEWWVLPAIIIIVNSKTPLDAALKTFVFFLISQPLVYLIQAPFSPMGFGLFRYYPYWLKITILTFPGAFLGWFVKKDKWYSGIILSVMTALLVATGINYLFGLRENFPNHFLSMIYCFSIIPIFIFGIFKKWQPRVIAGGITIIAAIIYLFVAKPGGGELFEVYRTNMFGDNDITLVGEPKIAGFSATSDCGAVDCVEIVGKLDDGNYSFKLLGRKGGDYEFEVEDESGAVYTFAYYYDNELDTVEVKLVNNAE